MSNRVEQLETTVSELESTIEGLTEELVETKERLRVIESKLDVDAADVVEETGSRGAPVGAVLDAEEAPTKEAAPDDVEQAVEADKEAEDQDTTEAEESSSGLGDDIIVA